MKYFLFDRYELKVNNETNFKYYYGLYNRDNECKCPACRNFYKFFNEYSHELAFFLENLGINVLKPAQTIPYRGLDKNVLSYGGYYHCCGDIISKNRTVYEYLQTQDILLYDGIKINFQSECDLKDELFPYPAFQINFRVTIPWVLDQDNSYCSFSAVNIYKQKMFYRI